MNRDTLIATMKHHIYPDPSANIVCDVGGFEEAANAILALGATPRPLAEYHEDMGPVLWWAWEAEGNGLPGRWLGEPPYVGSPNSLGITVEAHVRLISQLDQEHEPEIVRRSLGGWPGYHTHFTPLPPMPLPPTFPTKG